MKALTQRQQQVLSFMEQFHRNKGYAPTVRETAKYFEISIKGAHDHMKALEKKGAIQSESGRSRAIEFCSSPAQELVQIPILGKVAAGTPILAEENWEGSLSFPASFFGAGNFFALKVSGDSMIDAGIFESDIAILRQQSQAESGDIVVAQINEGYTLKRFFKEKNRIRLMAENPAYPNLFSSEVRVLGKLIHLVRSYEN
ncbi:MAG: transcriptional repressor LexA [Spirochaetaceae bacterium]|jgi:repressor LexA|nr:transcriptional repressor LexA [Spirochaetaceae bacterium]